MIPKVIAEKVKYKGRWFEAVEQDVDIGNGKVVQWDMLRANDAVAVIALDDENNVYLGKEYKPAHKGYIYTIAVGEAQKEDSEIARINQAKKELSEEFGINARKFEKLAVVANSGRSNTKFHIYLARDIYDDPVEKEEGEFIEIMKLPINDALNLVLKNNSHSAALMGILLAKQKLNL